MTEYDLLLIGAGHAHLGVLRRWALIERPPGRIALIAASPFAWYAGMIPAVVSGRASADDAQIDLQSLCRAAKVDLIVNPVHSLSAAQQQVQLEDGRTLRGKWLSLNVGGKTKAPEQSGDAMQVIAVKPFDAFIRNWQQWQAEPKPLAILGAGAAGVELAFAFAGRVPQVTLMCAGHLLERQSPALRLRTLGLLRLRGVRVREDCPVTRIEHDHLFSEKECVWSGSRLILASGLKALAWPELSGLGCDEKGYVLVAPTLQSYTHPPIFAVGDCARFSGVRKSAVSAQEQATILAHNLGAALRGLPLKQYRPGKQRLMLLDTGDGSALFEWHGYTANGPLYGRWKTWRDETFVRRHRL
ncbi:FAD-dependent oxidoreductase [Ectopseudomonas mendocina]|uniref:FAD-dependent oxidoreductase n=1 Tax=Ectopseudomonas mendocina TaxID=300 RepID=A0ABZ2RGW8_ECTME